MLLNPRTPLVIGTILVFMLGGLLAMYSPMPGKLTAPHAAVQGMLTIDSCSQCHKGSGISEGCLDCHSEIAAQLDEGRGYHNYLLQGEVQCGGSCHAEHLGPESRLVTAGSWGPQVFRAFRHPHVEFALTGKHERLLCESCHINKVREPFALPEFPDFPRHRSFLGLDQECTTCHEDIHTGGITPDCTNCHGQESFRPPIHFDHSKHFPLEGGHARADCDECHVVPPLGTAAAPFPFPFHEVRGKECQECHESPHRVFVGLCEACHPQNEPFWSFAMTSVTPEVHQLTGFRLDPPHDHVGCEKCHPPELPFNVRHQNPASPRYRRQQDSCEGCHVNAHGKQFGRSPRCLDCHDRMRFAPSNFGHRDHEHVFSLAGAHEAVACNGCHRLDPDLQVKRYAGTPTECKSCHLSPHGAQFATRIEATDCTACHVPRTDTFRIHRFDHQERTGYALVGGHASVDCSRCHVMVLESFGGAFTRVRRYEGTPTSCSGCHKDVHRGQFQYDGQDSCNRCHVSAVSWSDIRFDHDTQSRFALRGAHARLECSQCHVATALEDGGEFVRYRPMGRECNDCHEFRSEE